MEDEGCLLNTGQCFLYNKLDTENNTHFHKCYLVIKFIYALQNRIFFGGNCLSLKRNYQYKIPKINKKELKTVVAALLLLFSLLQESANCFYVSV